MKIASRIGAAVLALCMTASLAAGCSAAPDTSAAAGAAHPDGWVETLRLEGGTDWGAPNPFQCQSRGPGTAKMELVYASLLEKDETGDIGWLAESWTVDGKDCTFTLRQGAAFQDGEPLTTDDVAFTIDYYNAHPPVSNPLAAGTDACILESYTVVDERTITLTVKAPDGDTLTSLGSFEILPRHIWESVDDPYTYTGDGFAFVQGAPWYQTYVDYAVENGILSSADEYDSYLQSVSRAQFADIMAHALPESAYTEINLVEQGAIPDVDMSQKYSFSVYTLYRAGVLTGGEHAAFRPDDCITRAEAAAVAGRIIDPSLRQPLQLYAPLYVGFTKDDANEGAVVITGLTMSTENGTCYLTMDFDSQKSRFLSIMNASESLYILQVVVIDPGVDHFTFAFPIETLEEIYTSSPNPANERLTMEFYASGDPSSVMDRFYISIDQFEKYFEKSA